MKTVSLELGKTYIVTLNDGQEIEFLVVGGEPIMVRTSDGLIELHKLFSLYSDIQKK